MPWCGMTQTFQSGYMWYGMTVPTQHIMNSLLGGVIAVLMIVGINRRFNRPGHVTSYRQAEVLMCSVSYGRPNTGNYRWHPVPSFLNPWISGTVVVQQSSMESGIQKLVGIIIDVIITSWYAHVFLPQYISGHSSLAGKKKGNPDQVLRYGRGAQVVFLEFHDVL